MTPYFVITFVHYSQTSLTSHCMFTYVLVTEKMADLQMTLKVHLRFYNRISRSHKPCNENWHAHFFLRARSMAINASMSQG